MAYKVLLPTDLICDVMTDLIMMRTILKHMSERVYLKHFLNTSLADEFFVTVLILTWSWNIVGKQGN